jgi:hypothetical protein
MVRVKDLELVGNVNLCARGDEAWADNIGHGKCSPRVKPRHIHGHVFLLLFWFHLCSLITFNP